MTSTTVLPSLCTELHRYSKPKDAFSFHYLEPDDTGTWNVQPFAVDTMDSYDGDSPTYKETGVWLLDSKDAAETRDTLQAAGHKPLAFTALPEALQRFVIYCQAPIEWHHGLAAGEPELTKRVTVWVSGDLPI
jgi:hypothetical protein